MISLALVALALAGYQPAISCDVGTGYGGFASSGQSGIAPQIWLTAAACRGARRGEGIGMFVFLHELSHTTGITDEHQADCYAQDHLRSVLRKFGRLTVKRANREYADALAYNIDLPGYGCVR